jgi:hypothetical protein
MDKTSRKLKEVGEDEDEDADEAMLYFRAV